MSYEINQEREGEMRRIILMSVVMVMLSGCGVVVGAIAGGAAGNAVGGTPTDVDVPEKARM